MVDNSIIFTLKQCSSRGALGAAGEVFSASTVLFMPSNINKLKKHLQLLVEKILQGQISYSQMRSLFAQIDDGLPDEESLKKKSMSIGLNVGIILSLFSFSTEKSFDFYVKHERINYK